MIDLLRRLSGELSQFWASDSPRQDDDQIAKSEYLNIHVIYIYYSERESADRRRFLGG